MRPESLTLVLHTSGLDEAESGMTQTTPRAQLRFIQATIKPTPKYAMIRATSMPLIKA
ncbi:MAG: hypothetical protein P8101_16485 [Candidatus Thiodiazotropha sp.]